MLQLSALIHLLMIQTVYLLLNNCLLTGTTLHELDTLSNMSELWALIALVDIGKCKPLTPYRIP
jgi:hypothetical protein